MRKKILEFAKMFLVVLSVSTSLFFYIYTYHQGILIPSLLNSEIARLNNESMQQIFIQSFRVGLFVSVSSFLFSCFSLALCFSLQTVFKTYKKIYKNLFNKQR